MPESSVRLLRPRPLVAAIGAVACWTTMAWSQVAPEGRHHTTAGPGAGITQHGSPTGGFAASVPLDLPQPRGPLPVPVSIVYTGSARAGIAGVGWDVPLSFVHKQVSTWRRHPRSLLVSGDEGPERIQLSLGGVSQLMVPRGDGTYVPYAGEEYVELKQAGANWTARTLSNLQYTFSPYSSNHWMLTEIRDLVGTDHVTLQYSDGDLETVAFTYGVDEKLPLYEIKFVHEYFNADGSPFELLRDDELSYTRRKVLTRVEIRARNNHVPSLQPKVIRAYHLAYEPDLDTGKPRLHAVTMSGEEGMAGDTLPIAEYGYGSITSPSSTDIEFGAEEIVARNVPATFAANLGTTSTQVDELLGSSGYPSPSDPPPAARRETSRVRHVLRDFTGDGLPDLLFKEGSQWKLVANRLDSSGRPHLDGAVTSQWSSPAELHEETTFRYLSPTTSGDRNRWARQEMITSETWTTFLDWNGDGRLDVVDARAGASLPESQNSWRVWINQPAANGGIEWRAFDVRVDQLRSRLEANDIETASPGAPVFTPVSNHLPLSRSRSWPRVNTYACRQWACTNEGLVHECVPGPDCQPPDWYRPQDPAQVDSLNEWQLVDKNGDGYPDFVSLTMPIRECERSYETAGGPLPWSWTDCESGHSPDERLGGLLQSGIYSCSSEQHEWASSYIPFPGDPAIEHPCGELEPAEAGAEVFLNRAGPFFGTGQSPFQYEPIEIDDDGFPSGLEQWTSGSVNLGDIPHPAAGVRARDWRSRSSRARNGARRIDMTAAA